MYREWVLICRFHFYYLDMRKLNSGYNDSKIEKRERKVSIDPGRRKVHYVHWWTWNAKKGRIFNLPPLDWLDSYKMVKHKRLTFHGTEDLIILTIDLPHRGGQTSITNTLVIYFNVIRPSKYPKMILKNL